MKLRSLMTSASLALLFACAVEAAPLNAQEEVLMPEVPVTGQAAARPH